MKATDSPHVLSGGDNPDERVENQGITQERAIGDAMTLLRQGKNAVLSTLSKRLGGWPFGSVAPYALDRTGAPVVFISTIAEHTKNIDADDRVSLLVQEQATNGDVQAHGRLTVLGRGRRVTGDEVHDVRARYLARVPSAVGYSEAHDFHFYRLQLEQVRYIGGFGKIFWLDATAMQLNPENDPLVAGAKSIIEHMNTDHADALSLYCRAFKSLEPKAVKMVGVDQFGFDVECTSPDVRLRFDFDRPATPATIRPIVVEMVARARERLGIAAKPH
jgi:heme iron utilization protein